MSEPVLRVIDKENPPVKYIEGPIYTILGVPTILGSVTYRSTKGYNMTIHYGHAKVKMNDGSEKFGGYYKIKQVKIVVNEDHQHEFVMTERDGIMLPANETIQEAIDSAEMLISVMKENGSDDDFDE